GSLLPAHAEKSTPRILSVPAPGADLRPRHAKVSTLRAAWRTITIVWALVLFALPMALDEMRERLGRRGWIAENRETLSERLLRHGGRLRDLLVRLGPTFIKIGQMLGTRADLIPVEFLRELQTLHDRVPPFPDEEAFAT